MTAEIPEPPGQYGPQQPPPQQYGQPYYPPAPYGQPPYGPPPQGQPYYGAPMYPPPAGTNGMAIASMVLGILWIWWIGSVLALIFGYVARQQIKRTHQNGNGMAIAGIVLGWIGIAVIVAVTLIVLFASSTSSSGY